jgi:hypothetical protein
MRPFRTATEENIGATLAPDRQGLDVSALAVHLEGHRLATAVEEESP